MITLTAKSWGRALSQRRKELGLTQVNLAQTLGTTQAWISRVERGAGKVEFERVLFLTKALGLEVDLRPADAAQPETAAKNFGQVVVKQGPPPVGHPIAQVQARIRRVRS